MASDRVESLTDPVLCEDGAETCDNGPALCEGDSDSYRVDSDPCGGDSASCGVDSASCEDANALAEGNAVASKGVVVRGQCGHVWRATKERGKLRCPKCIRGVTITIQMVRELAEARGGTCLATEYVNNHDLLLWRCKLGHEWRATLNNVKDTGSWCPHCQFNVGEELARAAFEEACGGEKFVRTRQLPWLKPLEVDGYNEKLKIAFEYQGVQHAKQVAHFHRTPEAFAGQQERDRLTAERCLANGVRLFAIPHTVPHLAIREHVRGLLGDACVAPAAGTADEFFARILAARPEAERQMARFCAAVEAKGGTVPPGQRFVSIRTPLQVVCAKGHQFAATLEGVDQAPGRGPRFCPECGGTRRLTEEELRQRASSYGFALEGVGERKTKGGAAERILHVICPQGHKYDVTVDNFRPGPDGAPVKGCKTCHHAKVGASRRTPIDDWVAENGISLAAGQTYGNYSTKYVWHCAPHGHEIVSTLAALKARRTSGGMLCGQCSIIAVCEKFNIATDVEAAARAAAAAPVGWRCRACGGAFNASMLAVARRKKVCPHCK